ncbi:hypothetical protein LZ32DRAFT_327454 [Colletotrichum eremochloae]|nr:hypothetical protein LZ32DRAFT_327454 [Colletotrichum eremochloae]
MGSKTDEPSHRRPPAFRSVDSPHRARSRLRGSALLLPCVLCPALLCSALLHRSANPRGTLLRPVGPSYLTLAECEQSQSCIGRLSYAT